MTEQEIPETFYKNRILELTENLGVINERRGRIAWLRLLIILLSIVLLYKTWHSVSVAVLICEAVVGIAAFLYVVSKDADLKKKMLTLQNLLFVNKEEIKIIDNQYLHRESGTEYKPSKHAYAEDLDLFGNASLYQYINRCTTQQGKKLLAHRLLDPLTKDEIVTEQQAIAESKNKMVFLQQCQVIGMEKSITIHAEEKIKEWLKMPLVFVDKRWKWLSLIYPVFTIGFVVSYITDLVPSVVCVLFFFLCYLFASGISAKIHDTYEKLSKLSAETETLEKLLACIEGETFNSQKFLQLRWQLTNQQSNTTSGEVKKLHGILDRFDIRLNHFAFFFLNTFLLWDLHQLLALNKWKIRNEQSVANWFHVIAEVEYSASLATLSFNHPDWCTPVISDHFFEINGAAIGHPLLMKKQRVDNSFHLNGIGKIAIITGSNMGGKSTFLRSLGVNTVLALMGAPVCAQSFSVSVMKIMSSMRVSDNLAESTSTFYAELSKLKTIIEAVNKNEQVFILLDEILRGTNSLDRHTGSVALLRQLIQKEAVAVIATHDVELAKLENDYPQAVHNYHFDVQAEENELYFDYKLKTGICQSLNASILMRNIGIELE